MRRLARSSATVLLLLTPIFSACHHRVGGIAGSGNRQTQKRDVSSFSSIVTEGAFEIQVVCQKPASLEIDGDDNILPLITTEVRTDTLHIRSVRGYSTANPIRLRITIPSLDGLSVSGAGKIDISGVKNDKFEIDASGAASISVAGETKLVNIDTSGAGKIDVHKLMADRAVVDSKGVSRVDVYAKDELEVNISGPSQVVYRGDPKVNKTVHGPGSVEKKESEPA